MILVLAGGCSTVEHGAVYDPAVHSSPGEGSGLVIAYAGPEIEEGIVFAVWLNKKSSGKLFSGTFLVMSVEPGPVEVNFHERLAGFGPTPETFEFSGPPSLGELFYPKKHVQNLQISSAETVYFRLRKEKTEVFSECEETKETTTICGRVQHVTLVERVDHSIAVTELSGLKESL